MKDAVLVLGYNNTRINDVKKIRQKSNEFLNALTVLCKSAPTSQDCEAADYVIDVGLDGSEADVSQLITQCKKLKINIIALLPFSDPGTQLGAAIAKKIGLRGPHLEKVKAALDKSSFRKQEASATEVPFGYKKIKSIQVTSLNQLQNIYKELNGQVFLKPAKEGNSRGCINLAKDENIEQAWLQVSKYLIGGIVAEELIDAKNEYSWDHVCGYSWITEKKTTQNEYRAEVQQILPAPFDINTKNKISDAGMFMSDISGSNHGACHNELFYVEESKTVIGVEPNLRPAGMRIWDLAAIAFENFDPWKEWLLWSAGKGTSEPKQLTQHYYAGIRMIQAHKSGILHSVTAIDSTLLLIDGLEIVELSWTKHIGDRVSHIVKDNSEFIGFIIAKSKDYLLLSEKLPYICNEISKEVLIQ